MSPKEPTEPQRPTWGVPLVIMIAGVVGCLAAWIAGPRLWNAFFEKHAWIEGAVPAPTSDDGADELAPKPPEPPRCAEVSAEPFLIGEPGATPKPAKTAEPGEEVE